MEFDAHEWLRYQRHIQMDAIGVAGQKKLKNASVLIVGAGGLGCPVSQYLAGAGVGNITLVDGDNIELTNLHRQTLFSESHVGQNKALTAANILKEKNSNISVTGVDAYFSLDQAELLVSEADLVLDCTDNFATRYLINDVCINHAKPWVYASVIQMSGQAALFTPESACFRCIFPEPPENIADCNSAGVLSSMPGILGLLQANEALKYMLGMPTPLCNSLMLFEGLTLDARKIKLKKNDQCLCHSKSINLLDNVKDYQFECAVDNVESFELNVDAFQKYIHRDSTVLVDVRSKTEHQGFNIGGKHIPLDDVSLLHFSDPSKTYLFYCQSGVRSKKAILKINAELKQLNQPNLQCFSLQGGLNHYVKSIL